jgi:disulfide bond formation protein DsbB
MTMSSTTIRTIAAAVCLVAAIATVGGAWGFELIGNYQPCKMCLAERVPYYTAIPFAALALIAAGFFRADLLARLLLVIVFGIFVWSAYKGAFHAGFEWKWWDGPNDCAAVAGFDRNDILGQLNAVHPPSCDSASWRFPNASWGLSFAGWNAVISTFIAIVALYGALARRRILGGRAYA